MKKLLKIFLLFVLFWGYFWNNQIFAAENPLSDNIIGKAYQERREKMLELIGGGRLELEIKSLQAELEKLRVWVNLDEATKEKILNEIGILEEEIAKQKAELTLNVEADFATMLAEYEKEIELKKDLVDQLNISIKENAINVEKIDLLIENYVAEKAKTDETTNKSRTIKGIVFIMITIVLIWVYLVLNYLSKNKKLATKHYIYISFFLAFAYILFLIWFFFYLYPQFSIFLIFMSGYLLVINAHLIGSFVGSLIVLYRFKIGDVVRIWNTYWRISNISPLYISLFPISPEWVLSSDKPIFIPHINILKNSIAKDNSPDSELHNFNLTIWVDSWVDVMVFLEEVEKSVLQKFLTNKLKTVPRTDDIYRIYFDFTPAANFIIKFTWQWDKVLSSKVERKIVWVLSKHLLEARKLKELRKHDNKVLEENLSQQGLNLEG